MFSGKLVKLRIYAMSDSKFASLNANKPSSSLSLKSQIGNKVNAIKSLSVDSVKEGLGDIANGVKDNFKNLTGIDLPQGAEDGYEVMFNPETYKEKYAADYKAQQADNSSTANNQYAKTNPQEYSFDFVIDATGASGERREVSLDIKKFKELTGYNGVKHSPRPLILSWGTLVVRCVLTNMDISYTLFDTNGVPLRAKISTTFLETIPEEEAKILKADKSPDLTKVRTVLAGETLPLMAEQEYGDPSLYLEVARVNKLTNFRNLKPGTKLIFPPIEK